MGKKDDVECLVAENWPWAKRLARCWWKFDDIVEAESAAGEALYVIACKYVDGEEESDFQYYASLKLRSFLIDDWRKRRGRRTSIKNKSRVYSLYDEFAGDLRHVDVLSDDSSDMDYVRTEEHLDAMVYLNYFTSEARTVAVAVAAGWNQKEIADCWGVTESRISQILARSRERFFLKVEGK